MDDPMTSGELQTVREYLGLTGDQLAGMLGVSPRTLRAWEAGTVPIPTARREGRIPVRDAVERLEADTAAAVGELVAALEDARDPAVVVYRTDDELAAARPDAAHLGARWWRHVVARAATEVPGVAIFEGGYVDLYDRPDGTKIAEVIAAIGQPLEHDGVEYWPLGSHALGGQRHRWSYAPRATL